MNVIVSRIKSFPARNLLYKSIEVTEGTFLSKKGINRIDTYFNPLSKKPDRVILHKMNGKSWEYSYYSHYPNKKAGRIFGKGKTRRWIKIKTPLLKPLFADIKDFYSFLKLYPEAVIEAVTKKAYK